MRAHGTPTTIDDAYRQATIMMVADVEQVHLVEVEDRLYLVCDEVPLPILRTYVRPSFGFHASPALFNPLDEIKALRPVDPDGDVWEDDPGYPVYLWDAGSPTGFLHAHIWGEAQSAYFRDGEPNNIYLVHVNGPDRPVRDFDSHWDDAFQVAGSLTVLAQLSSGIDPAAVSDDVRRSLGIRAGADPAQLEQAIKARRT